MKPGITGKLFIWYLVFVIIFFGTVFILYINVRQMMRISEGIVNKNYKISSASKIMIENLLNMEENEKKYLLLKRKHYLTYFISAQKEFERSLIDILQLESKTMTVSNKWETLYGNYRKFYYMSGGMIGDTSSESLWIPETVIDEWIQIISDARSENEQEIESANRELNTRGRLAVQSGLAGLGISIVAGLLGSIFLANSMIRPIRELLRGIRSIYKKQRTEPIHISSRDEFGELAGAFNEMAIQLKEEKQMRSDFISMLSHEIRTPLTSIRESVNLIGEGIMGNINDRQRKFLEIANLEIGRVCNLLNRLMQAASLESGTVKIKSRPLAPCLLISKCLDQLHSAAVAKHTVFETHISNDLLNVMGDPEYLEQVFFNLLGNAIKFSDSGTKVIIRAGPDENSTKSRFSVCDSGPGIPDEEQSFIFNKYYRARGVRDQMDGIGLGLSICKQIIEAHGGDLWVKSKPGQGSTFFFTLPTVR
ncbi:MAG: HAMP domain-containing histidine kinase [Desulfobacteraceae bacterium]|nr:HAMP domain-containing histidine kinase [Desulfobacteraceae bacterium]